MGVDRHGLEVIESSECWQILASQHVGRLAVCVSDRPEVFPLNFVVDHSGHTRTLVFLTNPGTKVSGAVLGSSVTFEVDGADPLFHTGWSVVVHGRATPLERTEDLIAAERLALRPWGPAPKHTYLRLLPDSVTGRRIPAPQRHRDFSGRDTP